ncbi:GAF domain-containing sensor histidine kinase [Phototrophicus methaneseepsis]|uniref:GAF domain-containing sensor histidine kinase n=1 Tax=Phototrophicus methaneseepsis TaxID=2710758 RepID=A0A7S8EDC2_9CHLR|nr:GAF domain-containing sensor histidine kinase [Phototrophicus methaneseepsis]QPC84890.1 GAF domain-containing sensor histidine kinase [Phototrophicus methaneseepsis]
MFTSAWWMRRPNWVYFAQRWVVLIGFCILIILVQERRIESLESIRDLIIAFGIGAIATLLLGGFGLVKSLQPYTPLIASPGDWVIVGVFAYLGAGDPLVIVAIAAVVIVSGILRFGVAWGVVHTLGTVLAVTLALAISATAGQAFNIRLLPDTLVSILPAVVGLVLVAIVTSLWAGALDESNSRKNRQIKKNLAQNEELMQGMIQRAHAVSEMGAALIESRNFDRVLNATMDIGRLCVRQNLKQRVVSMVLLVDDDDSLYVATARGLSHTDENKRFGGMKGIIAETIETGNPVIAGSARLDPELRNMVSFQYIESLLCVPLRAHYDNYGVLLFGSGEADAFYEELIDTLRAVGIQATLAIQNAVLFSTLMEEKERIIEIEESARKALVRDLHDVPTQTVSAVAMRLSLLPKIAEKAPDQLNDEVEKIREMALRATAEIRHVMFTLRPLSLETQGLGEALRQLAEKTEKTYGQRIALDVDQTAVMQLEQKQEGALFYLIEEAVNNGRKYANASLIRVRITLEGSYVIVRVIDNGVGFDMHSVGTNYENRGSFGMVNMRERAELIGGMFDLQSKPGVGTTVIVSVPVEMITRPVKPERADATPRKSFHKRLSREFSGPLSPSS